MTLKSSIVQRIWATADSAVVDARRRFNERTGTPFNHLEFPTDIVFQVVVFRLLFKLSLRDLVRMFLMRGYEFTHETVREWEERFAPLLAEHLRRKRKGKVGRRWYVDETYVKVKGKWCYLYRAIDREGNLVDSMLSATRDMAAAQRFFRSTLSVVRRGSAASDDGRARFVSACDPRSARHQSRTSLQRVSQSTDRARSSRSQTAVLPDAGLRCFPLGPALLSSVRGSPAVLSSTAQKKTIRLTCS